MRRPPLLFVEIPQSVINRVVLVSTFGLVVQVYDYFVMGLIASKVWPKVFLPTTLPSISLLISLLAYLVAFLSKPLGGLVFGHLADVKGRKVSMTYSVLISSLAVLAISLVPSALGALGLALITVLRFVQGVGDGGNHGSSVALSYELVMRGKKTRHKMWLLQMGPVLGLMTSVIVVTAFYGVSQTPFFLDVGWRVMVGAAAVLLMFRSYLRTKVIESPDHLEVRGSVKTPILSLVKSQWREFALVLLSALYYRAVLNFLVYPFFYDLFLREGVGNLLLVLASGSALSVGFIFLGAMLAYKLPWKRVSLVSIGLTALLVPLTLLKDMALLLPLLALSSLGWGSMGLLAGEFDVKHRGTGAGLVFNSSDVVPSVLATSLPLFKGLYADPVVPAVATVEAIVVASFFSVFGLNLLSRAKK